MSAEYPWMQNVCYEPKPISVRSYRPGRAAILFLLLASIAVGVGVWAGLPAGWWL